MAVAPRIRKNQTVYFVANKLGKKLVWERVGTDRRDAERRDAAMKSEIARGVYVGKTTGAKTVDAYAREWLARRDTKTAAGDRGWYENHIAKRAPWFVEMRLEDLQVAHTLKLVHELRAPYVDHRGKMREPLRPRSHRNLFVGLLGPMFRDARTVDRAMMINVMELPPGTLDGSVEKRTPYGTDVARAMTTDERIRPDARMFATLLFYTGARCGEIAGLKFSDYDTAPRPLGALSITKQYDGEKLKTEGKGGEPKPRTVPVLPFLREALAAWWAHGFEMVYCRPPTKDDFIVPRFSDVARCHDRTSAYAMFQTALDRIGAANLTMHACRNTFISVAQNAGARENVLNVVTHNPKGTIIKRYTTWDWRPLCEAVRYFQIGMAPDFKPPTEDEQW